MVKRELDRAESLARDLAMSLGGNDDEPETPAGNLDVNNAHQDKEVGTAEEMELECPENIQS